MLCPLDLGAGRGFDCFLAARQHLPVADNTVDVILSNCVISLSPDKGAVFRDAFRVLKPGDLGCRGDRGGQAA